MFADNKYFECDLRKTKEFIALLFEQIDCFIEFRFVKGNEVVQRFYHDTKKIKWAEIQRRNIEHYNIFFGVCGRQRESGKKQDVSVVPAFWVDLDSESKLDGNTVLSYFKKYTPDEIFFPSYTVASGHGAHAYWFLEQPIAITDDEARLKAEGYLLGLAKFWQGDRVHDLGRVMRLPETINWKYESDPVTCVLASDDGVLYDDRVYARRFRLEDFAQFYIELSSSKDTKKLIFENVDVPDLSRLSQNIRNLITNPPPKGGRSNAAFIVMKAMQSVGYNHNEIKAVFKNNAIGRRYYE